MTDERDDCDLNAALGRLILSGLDQLAGRAYEERRRCALDAIAQIVPRGGVRFRRDDLYDRPVLSSQCGK